MINAQEQGDCYDQAPIAIDTAAKPDGGLWFSRAWECKYKDLQRQGFTGTF